MEPVGPSPTALFGRPIVALGLVRIPPRTARLSQGVPTGTVLTTAVVLGRVVGRPFVALVLPMGRPTMERPRLTEPKRSLAQYVAASATSASA